MVGILIVSYGRLAEALISSVRFLVGNIKQIRKVAIWPTDNKEKVRNRIRRSILEIDEGDGVLVLTDILGASSTNLSLSFLERYRVEVITGVNIPMLVTLSSCRRGMSLEDISRLVKKSGRRSIVLAKGVLGWKCRTKVKKQVDNH
jgi:PTS system mannose-specific IIA component